VHRQTAAKILQNTRPVRNFGRGSGSGSGYSEQGWRRVRAAHQKNSFGNNPTKHSLKSTTATFQYPQNSPGLI
jgi:hypothetical protein